MTNNSIILTEKSEICRGPVPHCSRVAELIVHNVLYAEPSVPVQPEDLHVYLAECFFLHDKFTQTTDTDTQVEYKINSTIATVSACGEEGADETIPTTLAHNSMLVIEVN